MWPASHRETSAESTEPRIEGPQLFGHHIVESASLDRQDGTFSATNDAFSGTAEEKVFEAAETLTTQDDEVRLDRISQREYLRGRVSK